MEDFIIHREKSDTIPPAIIPAPMMVAECATCSCSEKYPPDENPDTEILSCSTLYVSEMIARK